MSVLPFELTGIMKIAREDKLKECTARIMKPNTRVRVLKVCKKHGLLRTETPGSRKLHDANYIPRC